MPILRNENPARSGALSSTNQARWSRRIEWLSCGKRKRWGKVLALDPALYRECLDEGLVDYPVDCELEADVSNVSGEIPF